MRGDDDSAEAHRKFYDEYNAVLDMPAEYYLDTIKTVFQDFALVNGTWDVERRAACARRTSRRTALLTIEGELDDISGAGQTKAAHELCTGVPKARQFHYDVDGAGHYGIFSGRRWREKVYPRGARLHRRAISRGTPAGASRARRADAAAPAPHEAPDGAR